MLVSFKSCGKYEHKLITFAIWRFQFFLVHHKFTKEIPYKNVGWFQNNVGRFQKFGENTNVNRLGEIRT